MLRRLYIRDLVIVRELTLEFAPRMTALTGETGAGKSILIDALGLALGDKANTNLIREGCARAEVTAAFDLAGQPEINAWLAERALDDEDECLLRRVIAAEGRSRAFVNGSPVPIQTLRDLGVRLIDVHGQHAHQSLLRPAAQRRLLDSYGRHDQALAAVTQAYRAFSATTARLDQLRAAAADRANRLDLLRFQVGELREAALPAEELEARHAEQRRLAHAEQLLADTTALAELLYESDAAVQPALARALQMMEELLRLDPTLAEARDLLESARIQVEEAAAQLRDYGGRVEPDPQRLAEIDAELGRLHDLARKHRVAPETLADHLALLEEERAGLEHADETLATLEQAASTSWEEYRRAAARLSELRRATAHRLAEIVTASMQELAMVGGRFAIEVAELSEDQAAVHGRDAISFQVAANPGQSLAPLAQVASGGELSRISLAIQVATAGCGEVPTLIFDEVDVGIGGAVAEIVGRLLRQLGESRQVMCVTHLPQVAAQAHRHQRVSKRTHGDATLTEVTPLDDAARAREIARMLGGVDITPKTIAHAAEMMRLARPG